MPATRCQSYNQQDTQCGLTTKSGVFCWRHAANPSPIDSPSSQLIQAPRLAAPSRARTTGSEDDTRETPGVWDDLSSSSEVERPPQRSRTRRNIPRPRRTSSSTRGSNVNLPGNELQPGEY